MTNVTHITETALILSTISCSLSVFGGLLIIATYLAIPEIRNFTRKLVICLTVADLLTATGYSVSVIRNFGQNLTVDEYRNVPYNNNTLCIVQGTLTTFSSLASFFLTSITAIYIFDTVIHKQDRVGMSGWLLVCNMLSWGLPAWLTSLAYENGVIGAGPSDITGPWCWIKTTTHKNDIFWMTLVGKGWEIACYLITTSLYVLLILHMYLHHRRKRFSEIQDSLRDEDHNFLYVWFVLYVIRVWGTIRCLIYFFRPNETNSRFMEVLLYLQAVGDPLQAFCNSILFCFCDGTVRRKMWCCFRGTQTGENERLTPAENEPLLSKEPVHTTQRTQSVNITRDTSDE